MPDVTADISITLDGYASGEGQSRERLFGDLDAERLHAWQFDHVEENAEERAVVTVAGAYIMGRKMFDSEEGDWDLDWQGYWGPNPPLPRAGLRPRPPSPPQHRAEGGTVFHFVTDGIEAALRAGREAAGERTVSIGRWPWDPQPVPRRRPSSTSSASTSRRSSRATASASSTGSGASS